MGEDYWRNKDEILCKVITHVIDTTNTKVFDNMISRGHLNIHSHVLKNNEVHKYGRYYNHMVLPLKICLSNNLELIRHMMQTYPINFNYMDDRFSDETLINDIFRYCTFDTIKFLIEICNLSVDIKTKKGINILHYACLNKSCDVIQYMIDTFELKIQGNLVDLVYNACESNNVNTLKFLKKKGLKLNLSTKHKVPLIPACRHGNLDMVQLLIESGAPGGSITLVTAINYDHLEVVRYLIEICNLSIDSIDISFSSASLQICEYLFKNTGLSIKPEKLYNSIKNSEFIRQILYETDDYHAIFKILIGEKKIQLTDKQFGAIVEKSCRDQNVDLFEYYVDISQISFEIFNKEYNLFTLACKNGDFGMIKLMIDKYNIDPCTYVHNDCDFIMGYQKTIYYYSIDLMYKYGHVNLIDFFLGYVLNDNVKSMSFFPSDD